MINYQDFEYNGSKITFSLGAEVYVNATKMAKPFGKQPAQWLRLPSSQEFIRVLGDVRKVNYTALVIAKRGNYSNNGEQGTWMHKDVAIEFARWLSPHFAIWCNDRIMELLTKGKVEMKSAPDFSMPTADVTKDDAIISSAQREMNKEYTFAQVGRMILWRGRPIRRPLLQAWMYAHGFLCDKEGYANYPTELALSLGLMTVIDSCKRGSQIKSKKPRVRITMDGANYFIRNLQLGCSL